MSKQHQIHEESYQTGDSDSDDQGEEDGEEEEEGLQVPLHDGRVQEILSPTAQGDWKQL